MCISITLKVRLRLINLCIVSLQKLFAKSTDGESPDLTNSKLLKGTKNIPQKSD